MADNKFPCERSKTEERYGRYLQAELEVETIEWEEDDCTPTVEENGTQSPTMESKQSKLRKLMSDDEEEPSCSSTEQPSCSSPQQQSEHRRNLFGGCATVCCKNTSNPFLQLIDEIILNIFSYLPRLSLVKCAEVCKRWRTLGYDHTLWKCVNLDSKHFTVEGQLGSVLHRGVTTVSLSKAEILAPICYEECPHEKENNECEFPLLVSLDCSMSTFKQDQLSLLLYSCKSLQNLSLEGCKVNQSMLGAIALNTNLEVLNLALTVGINYSSMELISRQCRNLRSLNISWTNQTRDVIRLLCKCKELRALNLSGLRGGVNRKLMELLVKNCNKLEKLDLSDVALQIGSLKLICDNLRSLNTLSISRCTDVRSEQLFDLLELETLRQLNLFGFLNMAALERFSDSRPDIHINKEVYSPIARPISSASYEGGLWEQYVGFII